MDAHGAIFKPGLREVRLRHAALVAFFLFFRGALAAPEDVLRIYVARHGQTDSNVEHRLQGATDVPLNETGRRQARELASRLAGVTLDAIYSSTLQRSRQTAEALKGRAPLEALAGLNEQSLGAFEGLYLDGREPRREAEFERRRADPDDRLDGGESANQHFARVKAAVQTIRDRHPRGSVLIVAHGGTNVKEVYPSRPPTLWKLIPPDRLKEL